MHDLVTLFIYQFLLEGDLDGVLILSKYLPAIEKLPKGGPLTKDQLIQ
ncbi:MULTISPECIES: hypothetical protein [Bacillaceae]|nr:hypothetical protein [Bacillus sp. NTK034]MBN8202974.1 hypothetical protein [Bacillus sp. NTK034]